MQDGQLCIMSRNIDKDVPGRDVRLSLFILCKDLPVLSLNRVLSNSISVKERAMMFKVGRDGRGRGDDSRPKLNSQALEERILIVRLWGFGIHAYDWNRCGNKIKGTQIERRVGVWSRNGLIKWQRRQSRRKRGMEGR